MEDFATPRSHARGADPDLAAIVLAERPAPRAAAVEPEPARAGTHPPGFDARSVLVLALVVATMAGVIGWATSAVSEPPLAASAGGSSAPEGPARVAGPPMPAPVASPNRVAPAGIDLAPGRLVAMRSGSGGGIVRVAVANQGRTSLGAEGTQVLFLLDGSLVGERTVGAIDALGGSTTELTLESCPAGRHQLAVVVDPRGLVVEADERDNATTQSVSFGC